MTPPLSTLPLYYTQQSIQYLLSGGSNANDVTSQTQPSDIAIIFFMSNRFTTIKNNRNILNNRTVDIALKQPGLDGDKHALVQKINPALS